MCGVVGIFSPKKTLSYPSENFQKSLDSMMHRGPDGDGIYLSENKRVFLGHKRLSIVDLSTGGQPLYNEAKDIICIVNGEFYDFQKTRENLKKEGHVFATKSDSEILIHLYEEYGFSCLDHLRGDFSFILYDKKKDIIFAARDRFGVKPLYYHVDNNDTLFLASEAKALFALGVSAQWDQNALYHCFTMQYLAPQQSYFKNIHQLQPGHFIVAAKSGITIKKYWDINFSEDYVEQKSELDHIQDIKDVLQQSIKTRLVSDVPTCFHLSGGLDSSAVVGFASQLQNKPVDCFSVIFDHDIYNEQNIAEETAEFNKAKLNKVHVSQQDIFDNLSDAVYLSEGLAINGHLSAKYLLSKAIREAGFKVSLSGEGADELFLGYSHLRNDILKSKNADPEEFASLFQKNPVTAGVHIAQGDTLSVESITSKLGYSPSFLEAKASIGYKLHDLLDEGFKKKNENLDPFQKFIESFDHGNLKSWRQVYASSYLWTKSSLANYILRTLGDGTEMANSVEGRVPFLDHKLFEQVARVPFDLKIKNMTEKHVLREAAKDVITDTVYKRQKQAFMAPPINQFKGSRGKDFILDHLKSKTFINLPFFDHAKITQWIEKILKSSDENQTSLEPILMLLLTANFMHQRFKLSI